jgi:DNA-binding transcriptional MerR regulator
MTWPEFWQGHGNRKFTAVFNDFLDSQIADARLPLLLRVLAWVLRNSWGRFSDACVNSEGAKAGQVDCARDLNVFWKNPKTGELEPDRRKVNPLFQKLARWNMVRFEGRDILPIDNPLGIDFANSSPFVGPNPTNAEQKAKKDVDWFLEHVWKRLKPTAYEAYQTAEQEYKRWRTELVNDYKSASEKSEWGATDEEDRRNGDGQDVGMGDDNASEWGATNGGPSLYNSESFLKAEPASSSSSFSPRGRTTTIDSRGRSAIADALSQYAITEDALIDELITACQSKAPDCTADEIVHFIHEKGKFVREDQKIRNPEKRKIRFPAKFLVTAVPKCFESENYRQYKAEQARQQAEMEELQSFSLHEPEPMREPQPSPPAAPALTPQREAELQRKIAEVKSWLAQNVDGNELGIRAAKKELRELERELQQHGRKPAGSEPAAQAQKAGQR